MYSVIAYLTLFRLNELGFERFRFVLGGQEAHKMVTLLSWLTNVDNLNTWCVEDWCKAVDRDFVEVRWWLPTPLLVNPLPLLHYRNVRPSHGFACHHCLAWILQTTILGGLARNDAALRGWLHDNAPSHGGAPTATSATATATEPASPSGGSPETSSPTKSGTKRRSVKFNPPNLTQPKAPVVPAPERIEQVSFAKEVSRRMLLSACQ